MPFFNNETVDGKFDQLCDKTTEKLTNCHVSPPQSLGPSFMPAQIL